MTNFYDQKFVIITMARTGSNALVNALTKHSAIHCDYEVYHPDQIYTDGIFPGLADVRDDDLVGFLYRVMAWNAERLPDKRTYGFKLFFEHSDLILKTVVDDPSWRKIILGRHNVVDQYISWAIARQSGAWSSDYGRDKKTKIDFDRKRFLKFVEEVETSYSFVEGRLKETGQDFLRLDYEDVAAQRFNKVFDFLGVDRATDLTPHLKKQNSRRTARKINKPFQVWRWLMCNGYGRYWVY